MPVRLSQDGPVAESARSPNEGITSEYRIDIREWYRGFMNNVLCQNLQRRLLESPAGPLGAAEREHLRGCPDCRAFAQDVVPAGALLASAARQGERHAATALPEGLKSRVLCQIEEQQAREARRPAASVRAGAERPGLFARLEWRASLAPLAGAALRWRWAAAACLVLLLAGAGVRDYWQKRPLGRLEFACGPTTLGQGAPPHEGLGAWACPRGTTLSTPQNASALFSVGEGVHAAMAQGTRLQLLEKESLALQQGSVWLHVTPGGKGFKVQTPFGLVQVTGTQFGVTVTDRETRVDVAEGSVLVSQAQRQGRVTAGLALTADAAGITAPATRPEGVNLPAWLDQLLIAKKMADASSYVPSIGKRP